MSKNGSKKTPKRNRCGSSNSKNGTTTHRRKKKTEEELISVNMRNVKLTKECRKRLRKVKDCLWGNVADAIECGNWYLPVKNHKYTHMKETFEKETMDFFHLDQPVCIESFDTDIIQYDNHY